MHRFVLVIEYIGTNYAGSQIQRATKETKQNKEVHSHKITLEQPKTIQGEIEKALSTLTKQNIKTVFSGRTDAGVHAKEQYVHFDTDCDCINSKMINSLNGLLPNDISVKSIEQKDKTFHAQKSAKYRWYRYKIVNRKQRSAWDNNVLLVREKLDVNRINQSLKFLEGEHDFTAFKKVRTLNPAKFCTIYKACCLRKGDEIIIDIIANRFLYNMIRTIVGTLLMIEKKSLAPVTLKEILESKDRTKVGPTVSPSGLTLMKVIYNNVNMETEYENLFS